tara:strand:- start:1756 stop:3060 length:1305 start_codon:yes stop_codon:yes gene_type:complete
MYRPLSIISIFFLFIFLFSCTPVNNTKEPNSKVIAVSGSLEDNQDLINEKKTEPDQEQVQIFEAPKYQELNDNLSKNIKVLISKNDDPKIVNQFLNIIELAVYKRKIKNISFNIHVYDNNLNLIEYVKKNLEPGTIFFGPINTKNTAGLNKFCKDGVLFFSFSSDRSLANDCVFLINFFPHNEIKTIFEYLPEDSNVAVIYPENTYGYKINETADVVSQNSNSIIVNRASYKENLEDIRSAIKELGKYELRKFELNRQKKLLALKKDEKSKQRLKKLERFTTTNNYDFTHVLIADYGIRLLQVAPLLAYYDIDPNIVRFIGTGAWDDVIFFNEPSLQNAIFPGVEYNKRENLVSEYAAFYDEDLMRISTLPYDLVGLLAYLINNKYNLKDFYKLVDNKKLMFDGVDGNFYFQDNLIERELGILQIYKGQALQIN